MVKKSRKKYFFVTHKHFLKKISIILAFFWQKKALLLAFIAFFTSTFDKSIADIIETASPLVNEKICTGRKAQKVRFGSELSTDDYKYCA